MNNIYLDPIKAINQPREDFIRHLLTAYPIKNDELRKKFREKIEQPGVLWQQPYLEGSQPYESGQSILELVSEGLLHPRITALFPSNRRLYRHQQAAIETVVQQQENIVVATGTGSGKTECFLVPMLDRLLKEESDLAISGIRALILYPMNALVNDQVKRLRQVLCQQDLKFPMIRFGFYTSRTESDPKDALEALRDELQGYDPNDLRTLFTEEDRNRLNLSTTDRLVSEAVKKIRAVQALSRQEIQKEPPHILVTNYSMLEHMLIRPKERQEIFEASSETFNTLIVDEAHTYDGSTGTEVSMLIKRFKVSLKQTTSNIRCIATSASLGSKSDDLTVLKFARELFDEEFVQVIRGDRQNRISRLGESYNLPAEWRPESIVEELSILTMLSHDDPLEDWVKELSWSVPDRVLQEAKQQYQGGSPRENLHRFLWFALKQHPLFHRLISLLKRPQPWNDIVRSSELWGMQLPQSLNGDLDSDAVEMAEKALAQLLQLGTLARENPEDLPLLPVRLHLLFRGLEGIYVCINPGCQELYLNEKHTCDQCNSPVLELASCPQCGETYSLTHWDSKTSKLSSLPRATSILKKNTSIYTLSVHQPQSRVEEEDDEFPEDDSDTNEEDLLTHQFFIQFKDGWIGQPQLEKFSPLVDTVGQQYHLVWHRRKDDKGTEGCYLSKCAACGSPPNRSQAINRFISYTDAPLETMISSLFELLPEPEYKMSQPSKRKLLTFSDGRQDAAFFASAFQRNHTEISYRQMVWQAFQEAKNSEQKASVKKLTSELTNLFLETPISHPDRNSKDHHRSYCKGDLVNGLDNDLDCAEFSERRAKELIVREFAIPYARRSSLEAYALLACHIQLKLDDSIVAWVSSEFKISPQEAYVFVLGLTDIIRRSGVVSVDGSSDYFPETGGQGDRPARIVKGRAERVLFLEKSEEDRKRYGTSLSLLPRLKKTGEPMQTQNRTGWYFAQIFPVLPTREQFVVFFQEMQKTRLLVNKTTTKGFHLNWDLLTIEQTQDDWYQCNQCQQIVHVPELSHTKNSQLKLDTCRAYRCKGSLKPYSAQQIKVQTERNHQQHLIKNCKPLPLRSQEHTAQLGTNELSKRENDFRQGKINLLSCSTTLEMGVDIGELQAVVLRNFPPHVSNYQQRAGRAGRRTDGVAITLMYGQRRPHDRYYFEQPELLIAGKNRIPCLDPDNSQIQQRHVRAELLAAFLMTQNLGAEKVSIGDLFNLSYDNPLVVPDKKSPINSMAANFQSWLYGNESEILAKEWLIRLKSTYSSRQLIEGFRKDFDCFIANQLGDWNELIDLLMDLLREIDSLKLNLKERKPLEHRRDGLLSELRKIATRQLHEQLVQASILPIYGFPIDVVRLLTGDSNEFKSSKGKHRLERDRRLALSEYAPGQDIVVDDRVHKSVGVLRPEDLEKKYYWICKNCNHFEQSSDPNCTIEECPTCGQRPSTPAAQKVNAYRIPKAFITDWTDKPKVTPYLKPQRQATSQVFLANVGNPAFPVNVGEICRLTSCRSGHFFLANRGQSIHGSNGFYICNRCGLDLTEQVREQRDKSSRKGSRDQQKTPPNPHKHPITGKECRGSGERIHLGHEFKSDLLKIEFWNPPKRPMPLFGEIVHFQGDGVINSLTSSESGNSGQAFWYSLTYTLLGAAAQVLDIRREELDGLFTPSSNGHAEIVIYDNVPGGAGYSDRITDNFQEVLQKAYEIASTCSCQTSCYDCLRTYSNQAFHSELDRHLVAEFLQPIVEILTPDRVLKEFALGASRIKLGTIADELPSLFRMAQSLTLYLPNLQDSLSLDHNSPMPWMKLLTDSVDLAKILGTNVSLLLYELPQPDSQMHIIWRKRLVQWIDEGILCLYKCAENTLPILVFDSCQSSGMGLGLSKDTDYKWLRTRNSEGIRNLQQRLEGLKGRIVSSQILDDHNVELIMPNLNWPPLSLNELRERIGLDKCFMGSEIVKITYRDRYLYKEQANILAKLLAHVNTTANTKIYLYTRENSSDRFTTSASQRKHDLELSLASLSTKKENLKVTVYPDRTSNFEHVPTLEIWRADGTHYKVVFDKGVDFIEEENALYKVKKSTYIVICRNLEKVVQ